MSYLNRKSLAFFYLLSEKMNVQKNKSGPCPINSPEHTQ